MGEHALMPVNGACHCKTVRFVVQVPEQLAVHRCNCSICAACAYLHVIVDDADFELLSGRESLAEYRFNSGTARHLFCKTCGVKSFYVPRSHPDGYSVNLRCLELPSRVNVEVVDFDGRHWRENIDNIMD